MSTAREDSQQAMETVTSEKHVSSRNLSARIGALALVVVVVGSRSACKDIGPPVAGASGNPGGHGNAPGHGPSSSASAIPSGTGTLGSASPSAAASTSPTPKKSTGGGSNTPPTNDHAPYTVAGFPDNTNTGYPHGVAGDKRTAVKLTAYTGPMTITKAGTVIDSKIVNGALTINAHNVVIKNSLLQVANASAINSTDDNNNLLIEDTEITGQGKDASAGGIALISRTGYTLLRVNAHDSGDITRMDGHATIQDSWLHDPSGTNGAQHNDVIQSTNATFIRILHNRLENPHQQTSCILLKADLGPISNVVVDSNLMAGGGYSFYWYDANDYSKHISNGTVTNNRFLRTPNGGFFAKGGMYGPDAFRATSSPSWANNAWQDTGQAIAM
jgi:hypothetical protein